MISRWLRSVALTGLVVGTAAFVAPNVYAQSDPQAHIAASEVTLSDFKIGGDASVAAGPIGTGARSDVVADLITFNRAKGLYGGLNLDGTVVTASDDWNASFYGKSVLPPDILVRASVHNAVADKLLARVGAAANRK